MIGTISIKVNAAHPNIQLPTLYSYKGSPSSIRIVDVPRKIGDWRITDVFVGITYPDNAEYTVEATFTAGVWVATIQGSGVAGNTENGYAITANGISETGDDITGYVLGMGDVSILEQRSISDSHVMRLSSNQPSSPNVGDVYFDGGYPVVYDGSDWADFGVTDLSGYQQALSTSQLSAIEKVEDETRTIITLADNTTQKFNWSGQITAQTFTDANVAVANITSISVGEGVTGIGDNVFLNDTNLTSVHLPNTLTSLGHGTFEGCTNLTSLNLPESLKQIGLYTFSGLRSLTELIFPDSLETWYKGNGAGAINLTRMRIGRGVKNIPEGTLYESKVTDFTIPDNIKTIDTYAVNENSLLETVTIGDGVETIGEKAFYKNPELKTVKFGSGLKTIGINAFELCPKLTAIILQDGVESIGNHAFYNCTNVSKLVLPNTLKTVGYYAFCGCAGLTEVVIPASVTSLGFGLFTSCPNIQRVVVMGKTTAEAQTFMTNAGLPSNCEIMGCPTDSIAKSEIASVLNGIDENSDLPTVATALKNLATLCS